MAITADQLKTAYLADPEKVAVAFTRTLQEFGYAGLDTQTVRDSIKGYYEGIQPVGVIGMFVHGWLKEGMN